MKIEENNKTQASDLAEERAKHRKAISEMEFDYEDLNDIFREIVDIIGFENTKQLIYFLGGTSLYFPQPRQLTERKKREYICKVLREYGYNYPLVGRIFRVSGSTIRRYENWLKRNNNNNKKKQ